MNGTLRKRRIALSNTRKPPLREKGLAFQRDIANVTGPSGYSSITQALSCGGRVGWSVRMMVIGTMVARAQLAKRYMLKGAHLGSSSMSGGIAGVPFQSH